MQCFFTSWNSPKCHLRKILKMFEYMLQSHVSSWGFPSTFIDHSEFITVQCKKILSRAGRIMKVKCFEFSSIKRALRPHLRTIIAIYFNISICFPLWENITILSK